MTARLIFTVHETTESLDLSNSVISEDEDLLDRNFKNSKLTNKLWKAPDYESCASGHRAYIRAYALNHAQITYT